MSAQRLRIGILRLLDCAPVIVAQERGFFAQVGLDVTIAVEPSWANIADKLAYGMLDAAVMLGPLAVAMVLGMRGRRTDLRLAATLSREGNAIVMAPEPPGSPRYAVVHAYSSHDLLLREFLAARGIATGGDAIITLPPAEMGAALADGVIAGFCAGAPWGALAVRDGRGIMVATSATIAPGHPEKFLVLRGDDPAGGPALAARLRAAIGAATALCGDPAHRIALADSLAAPQHLDLPAAILAEALRPEDGNPVFMTGASLEPARADLNWTLDHMQRAGQISEGDRMRAAIMLSQDFITERA